MFKTIAVIVLFLIVVVGINILSPTFFSGIFVSLAKPLWNTGNSSQAHVSKIWGFVGSRKNILAENESLRQQLEKATENVLLLNTLQDENLKLKGLISDTNTDSSKNRILTAVVLKPPRTLYDTVLIEGGSDKGIKLGEKVYSQGAIVIGTVTEVLSKSSRVTLYSSSGVITNAIVERTNADVELVGSGAGNFEIHVPQDLDILKGETLVLPGLTVGIVGTVLDVESSPKSSFKTVLAKIPINISELRWVLVEKI